MGRWTGGHCRRRRASGQILARRTPRPGPQPRRWWPGFGPRCWLDRVGIHDNFFDLGGHSLLLLRVCDRLHAKYGAVLSVIDLFRYPNIDSIARHLEQRLSMELMGAAAGRQRGLARRGVAT